MNSIEQNFISEYKAAYEKKMARAIKKLEKTMAKIDSSMGGPHRSRSTSQKERN